MVSNLQQKVGYMSVNICTNSTACCNTFGYLKQVGSSLRKNQKGRNEDEKTNSYCSCPFWGSYNQVCPNSTNIRAATKDNFLFQKFRSLKSTSTMHLYTKQKDTSGLLKNSNGTCQCKSQSC